MSNNKTKILESAMQLFSETGYDGTSTKAIAQHAGVSEALIFRHYESKKALLEAIMQHGFAQIAKSMEAYAQDLDPRQAIVAHVEAAFSQFQEEHVFWRFATQMRFQKSIQYDGSELIEQVNFFVLQGLKSNFERLGAKNPEQEARILFALIDGVCLHWLQDPEQYPMSLMQAFIINKYQHAEF
jgi:AcrR family transcriptional regulator